MRDLALGLLIAYFFVRAFQHPWIGIMGWTLVSLMNLHRYTWVLKSQPVAAALAGATLIGVLITKDKRHFPVTRETITFMLLMLWICITLPFSFDVAGSMEMFSKVMKIDFMILVALVVLYTRQHIMALAWLLVFSIGFYGFKGGLFTLMTGGAHRVWGPMGTYIEGNNELALALIVTIPLMRFLQQNTANKWLQRLLLATMVLSAAAAIGTHSRGALLAIAAMGAVMWWRSESKLVSGVVIGAVGMGLVAFMPEHWTSRMETIGTYEEDASAMGRINAWTMAFNLAKANFFGGGFDIYTPGVFAAYAPEPEKIHAAHSIYFQMLGEHGFVGLFLYLLLWIFVYLSAGKLRKQGRLRPETLWLHQMGSMIQVSLVGFAVGGAFLSLAYFDLPYNLLVLVVLGRAWLAREAWKLNEPELPLLPKWLQRGRGRGPLPQRQRGLT